MATVFLLSACDQLMSQLGIDDPAKKQAGLAAEGRAVGGGCRHAGRAIEDCYSIYYWLPKDAIYEGWRDMDTYMRENNITTVAPTLPPPPSPDGVKKRKRSDANVPSIPASTTPAEGGH